MTYQNCKGDFLIVESFYVDEAKAQPMPVPEHIRIEYFTMYGNGSRYVVERDGDTCSSCSVSEDGMSLISNIPLSRYPLGTGELMKLVVEIVADPAFPDGKKYITTPGTTGIMLFPGVSDGSPEIQSSIVMPISQYGMSAYQLAVLHGFSGTEKEWLQSLKGEPGISAPAFDLLTTKNRKSGYEQASGAGISGNGRLSDPSLCVRFVGSKPASGWTINLYIYRNKKNKTFKKVLSTPVSECEAPELWSGGGYQTIVLPWTLMRIFWEMFDPIENGNGSSYFHKSDYDAEDVASAWMTKCRNGDRLLKRGGLSNTVERRLTGAMFSGTFGIRMANDDAGVYGDLHRFRINLFNNNEYNGDNPLDLKFSMKTDLGLTTQTYM